MENQSFFTNSLSVPSCVLALQTPAPPMADCIWQPLLPLSWGSAKVGKNGEHPIPLSHFQLVLSHYKSFLNLLVFIAQFPFSNKTPSDVNLELI